MSEHVATVEAATEVTESPADLLPGAGPVADSPAEPEPIVALQDLLVEEVSIDGMCGVY
jgi:mycofactocin precursor